MTKNRGIALLCLIPFMLFYLIFQVAPLVWVAISSFWSETESSWGWGNYITIFTSSFYLQAIRFSLDISFWSSCYGLLIAIVAGYSLHQIGAGVLQRFVMSFTNMTSNFAGVPLAFAFIILLGLNGCLTLLMRKYGLSAGLRLFSRDGMVLIYTWFQIPLGILLLYPAFGSVKREWQESAALLGASQWGFWRYIGLPVLTPALIGTFVILLANALGAYATIYALTSGNFNVVPVRIAALVAGDISLDPYLGSALAMLLVVLMLFITLVHQWVVRRNYLYAK